ncbi:MAG: MFS transporter [Pseudomonadota bacterium]
MSSPPTEAKQPDFPSIVAACVGIGAFGLALGLTYPLLSILLAERDVPLSIIGLNAASMGLGIALSTVLIARLTAWIRAGLLIAGGLMGAAIIIFAFGLTSNLYVWFLLRVLLGFNVNAAFVLTEAWVNEASADHMRGKAIGAYTFAMTGGFAIGPLGITVFGTETSLPFAVCAVLVAFTAIAIALLSRKTKARTASAPPGSLRKFAWAAPLLIAMVMAFGFADWTMISMMPIYFFEKGMDPGLASMSVAIVHFGMISFTFPIGAILDRVSRMRVAAVCTALTVVGFVLIPFTPVDQWIIWPVLFLLGGCLGGIYTAALTIMGARFSGGILVAGSAVFSMGYTVAGTAGMMGSGVAMGQLGFDSMPYGFAICFAVLFFAIILAKRRDSTDR